MDGEQNNIFRRFLKHDRDQKKTPLNTHNIFMNYFYKVYNIDDHFINC